ncbi:MAG TPA: 50S ribosomal protein L29 [Candidatus Omnitrophota bacterium]|nr:50S ribosomal protein L29 [Candidatus Omnitrophota bacterium]
MLKTEELRELSIEELQEKVDSFKKTLMQFRFQLKTGKLERQSSLKETKQDIARLLTIINEKKKGEKKS